MTPQANGMKVRASTDAEGLRRMTARDIRDTFVIGDLFRSRAKCP